MLLHQLTCHLASRNPGPLWLLSRTTYPFAAFVVPVSFLIVLSLVCQRERSSAQSKTDVPQCKRRTLPCIVQNELSSRAGEIKMTKRDSYWETSFPPTLMVNNEFNKEKLREVGNPASVVLGAAEWIQCVRFSCGLRGRSRDIQLLAPIDRTQRLDSG